MMHTLVFMGVTVLHLPVFLLRMLFHRPGEHRRVLVVQRAKIGDMVCTTPLFRSLSEHGDEVVVVCNTSASEVLMHNPHVSEMIIADASEFHGVIGRLKLLLKVSTCKIDCALSAMPGGTNALLVLWSCATRRILTVSRHMSFTEKCISLFCTTVEYRRHTRTFDHYMSLAGKLDAKPVAYKHDIFLSDAEKQNADTWLNEHGVSGTQFAFLSVGAGNVIKQWSIERFVEVAHHVSDTYGFNILFSHIDTSLTQQACSLAHHPACIDAGGVDLRLLCALIERASLFVSVDTGPLYIAHALGVPLVDIIGPVDPNEQPPIPGDTVAIVVPPNTQPTSFVVGTLRIRTEDQMRAIRETTVDMVVAAVEKVLH